MARSQFFGNAVEYLESNLYLEKSHFNAVTFAVTYSFNTVPFSLLVASLVIML